MDWRAATTDIRRFDKGWRSYRYSTDLNVDGASQTQIIDHVHVERFQLTGGAGNDDFYTSPVDRFDDILISGAGDDRLHDSYGQGSYDGGNGIDWVGTRSIGSAAQPFNLRLADTQGTTITINPGTDISTSWKNIEFVDLTTGDGNDTLDVRGIVANAARLNRDGWWGLHPGNRFDAGLEGNDTFAVDLGSTGHHVFFANNGTDTLIMDWRAATTDIRRFDVRWGTYRYSTDLTVDGASQTQIIDHNSVERFQLTGGAGNDELFGALLDDTLTGSAGADLLTGGGGTDVFRFSQLGDSTRSSMDRIVDYHSDDAIVAPITAATSISSATAVISDATLANNEALNIALGGTSFLAGSVHALQLGADTLLVINDSIAGYQFSTDCMIRLENFSVSTATPISLQVA